MIRLTSKLLDEQTRAYNEHRYSARARGIAFEMTFTQWLNIWIASGHLLERGCKRGMYCMSRFGDCGPYAPDNVEIILHAVNAARAHIGKIVSAETRRKLSEAKRGIPKSADHRLKLSQALKGRPLSAAHCKKIAAGNVAAWDRRRMEMLIEYCS